MCRYPYLRRLETVSVMHETVSKGCQLEDCFGIAYSANEDGTLEGHSIGKGSSPVFQSLLLVDPSVRPKLLAELPDAGGEAGMFMDK